MLAEAISSGEAILVIVLATIPIAALTFALGAGGAYRQIGKGQLGVEFEQDLPQSVTDSGSGPTEAVRRDEMRQMLAAKAYRQRARGEAPIDVEGELERLLAAADEAPSPGGAQLREEVRQLVIARNARRARRGEEPLDVEAEIERQLRDLEGLGQ